MTRGDVTLWRIAKHTAAYAADDLTGKGAKAVGGRWNRKGNAVVYTASTIALAALELLAHTDEYVAVRNFFLVRVAVPSSVWRLREQVDGPSLDVTWVAEPAGSTTLDLGDAWLRSGRSPLLMVPSVIVPEEFNVLINPAHPATAKVRATIIRQYIYDPRL